MGISLTKPLKTTFYYIKTMKIKFTLKPQNGMAILLYQEIRQSFACLSHVSLKRNVQLPVGFHEHSPN